MLNRHLLHKGIEYSNDRQFMYRYLVIVFVFTLFAKMFHIIAHQQPVLPALFNLPFNAVHSPKYPVTHDDVTIIVENQTTIKVKSRHHSAEWQSDLNWRPTKIITRGNCFAIGLDETNPLKFCHEDGVLNIERNLHSNTFTKVNPHSIDEAFLNFEELYVGGADYLSMTSIGSSDALKHSSGAISEVLNVMVALFHVCVDYYGIPGLFLAIFIIRSMSFYHDIYQAKIHVYRVLNIPKRVNSWKLAITTLGVIACTVLIIQSLFHLDLALPLDTSWIAIAFCYAAVVFRLYLQGSKLISIEGITLLTIVTVFALMESGIPGYFFHYFGFCTILVGLVRYLASHYYVRTLNRKLKNAEKIH